MKPIRFQLSVEAAINGGNINKVQAGVSHHEAELSEFRADHELAVEYLKAAMSSLADPDGRAGN